MLSVPEYPTSSFLRELCLCSFSIVLLVWFCHRDMSLVNIIDGCICPS